MVLLRHGRFISVPFLADITSDQILSQEFRRYRFLPRQYIQHISLLRIQRQQTVQVRQSLGC